VELVFLARHGETHWNQLGRRQGQLDSELTENGLAQAHSHGSALVGRGVDAVFSSPLGRALTTARLIGERLGLAVNVVDDLAEVHHGDFAGLSNAEIAVRYPLEVVRRRRDKYLWPFPGGESYADADVRAARALKRLAQEAVLRPLLVSHEMVGRMLLKNLLGLEASDALARSQPNSVVYEVDPVRRLVNTVSQ
jgi:broad specificity phosphatase PhoE